MKQLSADYVRQKSQRNKPLVFLLPDLVGGGAVAVDGAAPNRVAPLSAGITRIIEVFG